MKIVEIERKIVGTLLILVMLSTVTMAAVPVPSKDNANIVGQSDRTIVLRLDDVQGYAWDDISMNLTDTVLSNNMNITLGVIPVSDIDKDNIIKNYLINTSKNPRVEIAQHGYKHASHEYLHLSQRQAYKITNLGYQKLVNILGVHPTTFIPPYNEYNANTLKALSKLNFNIISSGQDEYGTSNGIMLVGYNTQTSLDQKKLVPVKQILSDCQTSLDKRNICVIMIHPEDYTKKDGIHMDQSKYKEFVKLLDGLKTLNARSVTFNQLNQTS